MIKISNLSKSFSGQTVLDHLDLDIQKGEIVERFRLTILKLIFLRLAKKKS